MKTTEPIKNESESKLAFMAYSELALDDDSGTPYRLIQNEPTPAPTKPTFSTKDQDSGNTLTQIKDDLVALHIGYNPKLTSATMLVDSGASHILVRQEHIHVLKDVVMSAPNTKSFASLKSAKKGAELSAIGRGLLQIGPFSLQAFIFNDDELKDTLLGLDPFNRTRMYCNFRTRIFPSLLQDQPRTDFIWIEKVAQTRKHGRSKSSNKLKHPISFQYLLHLRHSQGNFKAPDKQTTNMCNLFTPRSNFPHQPHSGMLLESASSQDPTNTRD
jgi:hypothetical protein